MHIVHTHIDQVDSIWHEKKFHIQIDFQLWISSFDQKLVNIADCFYHF